MITLAIDSSSKVATAALIKDGILLGEITLNDKKHFVIHASRNIKKHLHVSKITTIFALSNLIIAYIVIRFVGKIEKWLGKDFIFILRKFFGVILLALAVKLFASNLTVVIAELAK